MTAVSEAGVSAPDLLLEWASEMADGSWTQWCDACHELDVEPSSLMRGLSALGHVEVNWASNRFSCAPPTAAFLRRSSGCLLLTGARPRGFVERLRGLESEETELDFFVHEPYLQRHGPQTLLIEVDIEDAEMLCVAAGLEWSFDPAGRIAELLPIASLEEVASREDWPPREDVPRQRFSPKQLQLQADRGVTDRGLWFYDGYRRSEAWFNDGKSWWKFPTREFAPYLAHPEVTFLRHRQRRSQLEVPNVAPLPPLQARAATLASGRLPLRTGGKAAAWSYENVSLELAELIAASLATSLERLP